MTGRSGGRVRVTVASSTRRVDLVLPGSVPVAELVPELARSVGLLEPMTVHGGYRLVTSTGSELAADAGLVAQGVEDGGLLTVSAGIDVDPPRRYDDVVEAMVDVVEQDLVPWDPVAGRHTALGAGGLALGLGATALLTQRGPVAAGAAALVAATLTGVAIVLSRGWGETRTALAAAWTGTAYAAVAGLVLAAGEGPPLGVPVAVAGGAALLAGLVSLVGFGSGRALVLPPVVLGATLLATGLLVRTTALDAAAVLTAALALSVTAGSAVPWLALGATGSASDRFDDVADAPAESQPVDRERVAADARVAHEILLAVSASVGALLVLVAPLAVSSGISGTALAVLCSVVVLLRTRQYRLRSEVLAGLVSGTAGLVTVTVAVLWLHPSWRAATAAVLVLAGTALVALTVIAPGPSARRAWLGDLAEGTALVALLPVLVVATGLFSAIRS